MDSIARLAAPDRLDLFNTVASHRGDMSPLVVEKDFWVCWCLKTLFTTMWPVSLIFKGGTSLCKAYGLIRRFSEDVDLSVDRKNLGFAGDREPANAPSGKQAQRLLDELTAKCAEFVSATMVPMLRSQFEPCLGTSSAESEWTLETDLHNSQTIVFQYPSVVEPEQAGYIRRAVRLEIGARSEHWPFETKAVTSYAAEEFPGQFSKPSCEVCVLSAVRTFWEKATILHALCHKPAGDRLPDRMSRHYYDVAMLADSPVAAEAIAQTDLLLAVAEHKALFFKSGWANYETARPGTLRLVPPDGRIGELRRDYRDMADMFFDEPLAFDVIVQRLGQMEDKVNALSRYAPGPSPT